MNLIIVFTIFIIILYFFISKKIKIKVKTFFKKGFKVNKGIFGIYCYCGFQGNGKTYSCAEYVYDNKKDICLFSNVRLNYNDYIYFNGFKEMLQLRDSIDWARYNNNNFIIFKGKRYNVELDKQIVFIYDEIFSELQRGSKINTDVLDFITQMRKRKFILLTTSQIWNDIPITWRRLTRYQIDCKMMNFLGFNILVKIFHDAETMKWDNDEQDFVAPIISTTITHTRKIIANSYDTFELIHNRLSSFNAMETGSSIAEKEELFPLSKGELKGVNVSRETIDDDFWEGETYETLTGLRNSVSYVNVKNE